MNAIAFNPSLQSISTTRLSGLNNQATLDPINIGFASLLGGLINQTGEAQHNPTDSVINLDDLLAQLDQLLTTLEDKQIDEESCTVESIPIPIQQMMDQMLSSPNGEPLLGNNDLAQFRTSNNGTLTDPQTWLSNVVAGLDSPIVPVSYQTKISNISETQQTQLEILQALKVNLLVAKEASSTLSQDDLVKLSQWIKQMSIGINGKTDLQRDPLFVENREQIIKGFDFPNLLRGISLSNPTLNNQSQSMLNEQSSGDSSESMIKTSKVGFHQMMLSNIQSLSNENVQQQTTEPVVRSQHIQKDMNEFMVRQLQMTRFPDGVSEARIKLFPDNLGAVEVKLIVQQGILTAKFITETHAGKELLESQLAGLRASLISSGLQVDRLEVNMPYQSNNGQAQDSLNRQGNGNRDEQPQEDFYEDDSEEDFSTVFEEFSQAI